MPDPDAVAALCRTYLAYRRLGARTIEGPGCRAIRQDAAPLIYDVNHLQVDPGVALDSDRVLAFLEEALGDRDHRVVVTTPLVDPSLLARLALEDYRFTPTCLTWEWLQYPTS